MWRKRAQSMIKGHIRNAAKMYGVPPSTLHAKLTFAIPIDATRGPTPYLTCDEEQMLVEWIFYCSARGFADKIPISWLCTETDYRSKKDDSIH